MTKLMARLYVKSYVKKKYSYPNYLYITHNLLFTFFFFLHSFITLVKKNMDTAYNNNRFSLVSCMTEDSMDSNGLATPLDASPRPPPSTNTFSVINIVNDDPLPNTRSFPDIASTYTTRRRAQTSSPRPVLVAAQEQLLQQQPMTPSTPTVSNNSSTKFTRFWPKFKQSILFTQSVDNKTTLEDTKIPQDKPSKNWFGKNRTRIGTQR